MTTKIVANGGTVVLADQWFPSSKTCHHCGHIHQELKLSDRTYNCPHCGTVIDRDLNAALVLSQYGEVKQKTRVGCTQNYACEHRRNPLPRLKQEISRKTDITRFF